MYSKVVVPLDGSELSERSLPYARLVAGALSIPVQLVEAFNILPAAAPIAGAALATQRMLEEAQAQSEQYLDRMRNELRGQGYVATATALPGAPSQAIIDWVGDDPDALVVMSTHGRGGIARWALGSVADKVLHSVPNPMLLVRSTGSTVPAQVEPQAVLTPLDGSELSELSLEHAAIMATALRARIILLRVNPDPEVYRQQLGRAGRAAIENADSDWSPVEELARADAEDARVSLERAERRLARDFGFSGDVVSQPAQSRNVAEAIVDLADSENAIAVMTTHGRSGINRLVLGSITDRVVRHSNVPVLVVRQSRTGAGLGIAVPADASTTPDIGGAAAAQPA